MGEVRSAVLGGSAQVNMIEVTIWHVASQQSYLGPGLVVLALSIYREQAL